MYQTNVWQTDEPSVWDPTLQLSSELHSDTQHLVFNESLVIRQATLNLFCDPDARIPTSEQKFEPK